MADDLIITSRSNSWFKRFRAAVALHQDEIVVEGPKHVRDCVSAGWIPISVALREGSAFEPPAATRPVVFSESLFRLVSDTVHSQGVAALFARPSIAAELLLDRDGVVVVLDGIQDPGNAGTIVRLAAAFGAAGVLAAEGTADLFSPKSIRSSAGAALSIPIAQINRSHLVALARAGRLPLLAASVGGRSLPVPLPTRFALVLGSEGQGVAPAIAEAATAVGVEISSSVESLNVGAAAAILLWQIQNARRGVTLS